MTIYGRLIVPEHQRHFLSPHFRTGHVVVAYSSPSFIKSRSATNFPIAGCFDQSILLHQENCLSRLSMLFSCIAKTFDACLLAVIVYSFASPMMQPRRERDAKCWVYDELSYPMSSWVFLSCNSSLHLKFLTELIQLLSPFCPVKLWGHWSAHDDSQSNHDEIWSWSVRTCISMEHGLLVAW